MFSPSLCTFSSLEPTKTTQRWQGAPKPECPSSLPDVKVKALMTQQNQLEKVVGFEGVDLFSSPDSLIRVKKKLGKGARCTQILF